MSGCDLPAGGEQGPGADTVSLLALHPGLAPPSMSATYAICSLWPLDICAGMHGWM